MDLRKHRRITLMSSKIQNHIDRRIMEIREREKAYRKKKRGIY